MSTNTRGLIVATTALTALTWCAAPALAQRGRAGGQGHQQGQSQGDQRGRQAQPRQAPPQVRPEPARPPQPPPPQARPDVRPTPQAPPRQVQPRQAPPVYRPAPPPVRNDNRNDNRGPYQYQRPRNYDPPRVAPYYSNRSYVARRPVFVQPFYAFRPWFSLNLGIRVGFGVSYPYQYWDPFAFYNFRLDVNRGYNIRNYYDRVGGLSFDIDPYDASIFIDGQYVGVAADFGPNQMPLTLLAGRHHVDLRAEGCGAVSFDITVVAGQVIPYQGSLPYWR